MSFSIAHADLGSKHTCLGCTARFYDLNKQPIVCPKCQATFKVIDRAAPRIKRRRRFITN